MFETLSDRLTQVFSSLRGRGRLSPADIEATCREIRIALLEADVALPVARQFVAAVAERAASQEVSAALNPTQQVIKIVHEELITILGGEARRLRFAKVAPTVVMLAGLQGSGKTTLAAKLALWLREQGNTPMLVAADLQRPNAVQQLQVLGERASVPVFAPEPGDGVGDPVAVARQALDEARRRMHNIVVIDTAGRLGIDEEMMRQAAQIRDAVDPDEILFVVDAMIGQDAVVTAQAFLDGVGYDGVVLTKLDGDARGGAALSIAQLTGKPIMFASSGEKLGDFDLFHPDRMASRILDMGDMLTLIEQAERAFDADQTAAMAGKLASGEGFTLEDFVEQLSMIRKLGPIGNLLGMLPGAAQNRELLSQVSDADLDRAAAIVNSMTPQERRNPKILNGSRRSRIARGAGVTVGEVNNLVVRFLEGQKMMRQMLGGGGMPGMPPIPGMRRGMGKGGKSRKAAKKKHKGGRPGGSPARTAGAQGRGAPGGAGGTSGQDGADRTSPGGLPGIPPGLQGAPPGLRGAPPGTQGPPAGLRGASSTGRARPGPQAAPPPPPGTPPPGLRGGPASGGVRGQEPDGLRGQEPDGLRGQEPDGLRGHGPDGLRGHGPDGLRGYGPDGLRGYGPDGLRGHGPDGLRGTGAEAPPGPAQPGVSGEEQEPVRESEDGAEETQASASLPPGFGLLRRRRREGR